MSIGTNGLLEDCESFFGTKNLYEVLSVPATANSQQIKKAYYKLSLQIHPDKVEDENKEKSNKQFQIATKIHCLLSDEEKRRIYDETGDVGDENGDDQDGTDFDWCDYWRKLFPKITVEDIKAFGNKYKGSEDEKNALKKLYLKYKGDLTKISDCLMLYSIDEEPRYRKIIDDLIENDDEMPVYESFFNEPEVKAKKRQRRARKEAKEVASMSKAMGLDGTNQGLMEALAKRNNERKEAQDSFFKRLEEKYATPPKKQKKGKKN